MQPRKHNFAKFCINSLSSTCDITRLNPHYRSVQAYSALAVIVVIACTEGIKIILNGCMIFKKIDCKVDCK